MYARAPQPAPGDVIGQMLAAREVVIEVWPENWPTFALFADLATQWRIGVNGPTGLDYLVLHRELDDLGLTGEERQRLKDDIRLMEHAALAAMRED